MEEPIDITLKIGTKSTVKSNPTEEQIADAIKTVEDPDVGVDIYNMGLIYSVDIDEMGNVKIDMSLTSPTCPYAETLVMETGKCVSKIEEVGEVNIQIVWDPPWTISMMSEDARFALDLL